MAANWESSSLRFPAPGAPWEPYEQQYESGGYYATPPAHQWAAADGYPAAPAQPPVFFTAGQLTLASSPSKSGGCHSDHSTPGSSGSAAAHGAAHGPPPPRQHQQRLTPATPAYTHQLELHNAELLRQCQELQERLEAAAAAAAERQDSPARSGASTQLPGGDLDAERRLERRLAAKQREAEAAAAALAAAQQQVAAREAEVEAERRRAAELADELAHSRDDALKREKEVKALQQRLEAATSHAGLLDDSAAALRRQGGEMGKALAQRDVAIRGLEERLQALQVSQGSRDRQLEAAAGEREALLRDNAALHRQAQALQAEVRRLEAALAEARGQAAALRSRSRELEVVAASAAAAAAAAAQRGSGTTPPASATSGRQLEAQPGGGADGTSPAAQGQQPRWAGAEHGGAPHGSGAGFSEHHPHQQQRLAQLPGPGPAGRHSYAPQPPFSDEGSFGGGYAAHGSHGPASWFGGPNVEEEEEQSGMVNPRASLQALPYRAAPAHPVHPQQQRQHQHQDHAFQPQHQVAAEAVSAGCPDGALRVVFQRHNQPAAAAGARYTSAAGPAGSDTCSVSSRAGPPSVSSPFVAQPGGGEEERELTAHLQSVGLGTGPGAASPFGTDDTLQDMLARTQALEGRLLALNAERNELEAESARMPSHTAGRTLQERRRRAEVERRLEAIGRECSNVRLQLRRLGVK